MEEASGSIPLSSTSADPNGELGRWASFYAGLVAAEGCFSATPEGHTRRRFVFSIEMAARDQALIEGLRALLGRGSIQHRGPRGANRQPSVGLFVNSRRAHAAASVPFFAAHLARSSKRQQFRRWIAGLGIEADDARPDVDAAFLMGFVAGEGSFVRSGRRFRFAVAVAAADRQLLEELQLLFGVGGIDLVQPRRPHHQPTAIYRVGSVGALLNHVAPIIDRHLLPCHKRTQFDRWYEQLSTFWEREMRRRRPCEVPGCTDPRRAKGLCRSHYYRAFGR